MRLKVGLRLKPPEGPLEEGYVTFPTLPGRFMLRAGKMRAAFGRINTFHIHTLPWIDRPLATFNLLGGSLQEADVGTKDAGISITRTIPLVRGIFLEGTGEVFRGDSGSLFKASRRSDLSTVGHIKGYADLSESANLELGSSYARGPTTSAAHSLNICTDQTSRSAGGRYAGQFTTRSPPERSCS